MGRRKFKFEDIKYPGSVIDGVRVSKRQFDLALYHDYGGPETQGNMKASFIKAYPTNAESTAAHASAKFKEPGVIAAREYLRKLHNREVLLDASRNNKIVSPAEIMELYSEIARNEIDEYGRRRCKTSDQIKAITYMAQIHGMFVKNEVVDNSVKAISIVVSDNKHGNVKEVIDTQFKEIKGLTSEQDTSDD